MARSAPADSDQGVGCYRALWWACGGQQLFQALRKNAFHLLGLRSRPNPCFMLHGIHKPRTRHAGLRKPRSGGVGTQLLSGRMVESRWHCWLAPCTLAARQYWVSASKQDCAALRGAAVRARSFDARRRHDPPLSRLPQSRCCVALRPNTLHSVGLQLFDVSHSPLLLASGCHVAGRLAGQSAWTGPRVDEETKFGNGGFKSPLS